MEIRLETRQQIVLEKRLVLSQTLTLRMMEAINNLRRNIDRDQEAMYIRVMEEILANYCPNHLQQAFRTICMDEPFRRMALSSCFELSQMQTSHMRRIAVEYLFEATRGEIRTQTNDGLDNGNLDKAVFVDAFLRPNRLTNEIRMLEDLRKTSPDTLTDEAVRHMAEYRTALNIARSEQTAAAVILSVIRELLAIQTPEGARILPEFFLEAFILGKFTLLLPERIARRFVKRFGNIGSGVTVWNQRIRDSLLNTIGEFVLVCMGIISPNLFTTQKGVIDEEILDEFSKEGFDARAYLKRLGLASSGAFFWNRWHTLSHKPSVVTDELIRHFITQTVRADAKAIYQAVAFEEYFSRLKSASQSDDLDREEKENACVEIMLELLTNEKLIELLLQRLKTSWMDQLKIFYPSPA